MQLTLGPILFNWDASLWRDFYARVADEAAVDAVCLGEVVCSKRQPFHEKYLSEAVERLTRAGKQVVLSSLALVTLGRERKLTAGLAQGSDLPVEANDVTCLPGLAGRSHWIGPFVNVYNEGTLNWLATNGAERVCIPPELPLAAVAEMARACPSVVLEVWAFGRAPLAISARCYHARLHKLAKDNCRFVCEQDPDGLIVDTLDDKPFLAINGVQTLSSTYVNLIADLPALAAAGVSSCRLSPQTCDMIAVTNVFRSVLDGQMDGREAWLRMEQLCTPAQFSNGFLHGPITPGWRLTETEWEGRSAIQASTQRETHYGK
jgi:collagenase-like PrtC family protease